jgi:hypothetical protein
VLIELELAPKDIAALTILMIVVPLLIFAVIRVPQEQGPRRVPLSQIVQNVRQDIG